MASKNFFFWSKSSEFCTFWSKRFGSNFASMWSKYVSYNVSVSICNVSMEGFNGKLTAKIDFILCHHYWSWNWKSQVFSYIIWLVFGPHAGEIWTNSYGTKYTNILRFLEKKRFNFGKRFDAILEDVYGPLLLYTKVLNKRLSSFIVPKITVVWYV